MSPKIFKVADLGKGQLFIMPKPNSETLESDIQYYQSQGVTKIVSLLQPHEIEEQALQKEAQLSVKNGLVFENFPVKDMDIPEIEALKTLNAQLKSELENGAGITIHCHGGRGRAGTVVITLMKEFGYTTEQASQIAQTARQDPNVPVCDTQREFVKNYEINRV